MSDLEAKFRVSLQGRDELSNFFQKSAREAKTFQSVVGGAFSDTAKQIAGLGANTAKTLASFATGNLGVASVARGIFQLRDALNDLGVKAGLSRDAMEPLRQQINSVAKSSNQMQDAVVESLSAFVEKTGDIETARRNLELYGKVATATGASMADVARVGVELSDKLNIKDQAKAFAILSAQSKAGAVEIRDLATKAPRIFAAAAQFGVKGEEGLRGTGALAQAYAKGFGGSGTSASVATSIENTFADLMKNRHRIEAAGIKVKGRDPYEVIKDIIVKTGGDPGKLLKHGAEGVFDIRAMRGINVLAKEYRETGGFGTYDKFKNVTADPATILQDFGRRMESAQQKLIASQIKIAASLDNNVGPILERVANQASKLASVFDYAASHLKTTVATFATFLLSKQLLKRLGGGGGPGGGAGGVQHVWVDNWSGGGPGGGPGGAPGGKGKGAGGLLDSVMAVVGAGLWGYSVGSAADEQLGLSDKLQGYMDAGANKATEELGAAKHNTMLARKKLGRQMAINAYMGRGMDFGHAVAAYEGKIEVQNKIQIHIDENGNVSIEDTGTRAPEVMVKRGAQPFSQGARRGR